MLIDSEKIKKQTGKNLVLAIDIKPEVYFLQI
jgi:hypothetical protein